MLAAAHIAAAERRQSEAADQAVAKLPKKPSIINQVPAAKTIKKPELSPPKPPAQRAEPIRSKPTTPKPIRPVIEIKKSEAPEQATITPVVTPKSERVITTNYAPAERQQPHTKPEPRSPEAALPNPMAEQPDEPAQTNYFEGADVLDETDWTAAGIYIDEEAPNDSHPDISETTWGELTELPQMTTDNEAISLIQDTIIEAEDQGTRQSEASIAHGLNETLEQYFETLPPEQVSQAEPLLRSIVHAAKNLTSEQNHDRESNDDLVEELEQLCASLFTCLDIDYTKETLAQFLAAITNHKPAESDEPEVLTIEELNSRGTHEYKPYGNLSILSNLAHLVKQKMLPRLLLGTYALQALQAATPAN